MEKTKKIIIIDPGQPTSTATLSTWCFSVEQGNPGIIKMETIGKMVFFHEENYEDLMGYFSS
jgi:hypothetical protein